MCARLTKTAILKRANQCVCRDVLRKCQKSLKSSVDNWQRLGCRLRILAPRPFSLPFSLESTMIRSLLNSKVKIACIVLYCTRVKPVSPKMLFYTNFDQIIILKPHFLRGQGKVNLITIKAERYACISNQSQFSRDLVQN